MPTSTNRKRNNRPRTPRSSLSRERIVRAALALIDSRDLESFNMRDLGAALDASPMSIYRHFRNKSELIDAAVDDIVSRFSPAARQGSWQREAKFMSMRIRAAVLEHPNLAYLIGRELRRSPISLGTNASIIARLRESGVPPQLLARVYWTVSSYTMGYVLLEAQAHRHRKPGAKAGTRKDRAAKLATLLDAVEALPAAERRYAADVLARPLNDRQFLFGLDCLIVGLEATIAGNGIRQKRKPR